MFLIIENGVVFILKALTFCDTSFLLLLW